MSNNFLDDNENERITSLYKQYLSDPDSVDDNWRLFFEGYEFAKMEQQDPKSDVPGLPSEFKVINLINGYRTRGHLFTHTNPVRERRKYSPGLELSNFDLSVNDMDTVFQAALLLGMPPSPLKEILSHLEQTYCGSIGAEYKYIRNPEEISWLEKRMEGSRNGRSFSQEERIRILRKVCEAVTFENFLHKKYVGQKSFSLEGCEALIPALDAIISAGAEQGIREFTLGMTHRGRLNVLANILRKSYQDIFREFEDNANELAHFSGDVKYHLGYSSDVITENGKKIHLSLAPNPSHLEAVDPVVQGIVRSKIDQTEGGSEAHIVPILIHGDAAIAGQGVVYEVIQMSQLKGYRTGGTIHFIINNQIGFTTNYLDARSSTYCTDVAKVTLSPVFHVNGDDVESLIYVVQLALEFRQKFHRDIFIDVLGFRKYGHNEIDEPRFTQPLLYKAIASHPNLQQIYSRKLVEAGEIDAPNVLSIENEFKELLLKNLEEARQIATPIHQEYPRGKWKGLRLATNEDFNSSPMTGVPVKDLLRIGRQISTLPADKKFFDKTVKLFSDRKKIMEVDQPVNWAMAELLAYGTLLCEGFPVRLSGQDVERGTFSHRHAVVPMEDSEEKYCPLNYIDPVQAPFYIYNSLLSEYGVLGFEFGYALSSPNALVIWEAQFGDFNNGAQIIIDQYLCCAEVKWRLMNGLVMLLPHGYDGQGAEHSSGRMERFLQLCADLNMQVINCSTPANFFHVLRRQLHREFRKPLVVFSPKNLLRHPRCVSPFQELSTGSFQEILDDPEADPTLITRVIFCSGKFYYELLEKKEQEKISSVALVRMEQLYPFPRTLFQKILNKYSNAKRISWAQEEPENMGALMYLTRMLKGVTVDFISRPESASPATGSHHVHEREQKELIDKVFENKIDPV